MTSSTTRPPAADQQVIYDAACQVLDSYATLRRTRPPAYPGDTGPDDSGPAVLAALTAPGGPAGQAVAGRALTTWLDLFRAGTAGIGLYQGLAGMVAGLQAARSLEARLARLADAGAAALAQHLAQLSWPPADLEWRDYDLVSGPAGAVLALATNLDCAPDALHAGARLLTAACDRDDLESLRHRARPDDELRRFNHERINVGIAHGVTGVAAALAVVCERTGCPDRYATPLRRVSRWLAAEAYTDEVGLLTWPPVGAEGGPPPAHASRRQAWCYGTPATAWTLWYAGEVLGEPEPRALGAEAMSSFCAAFDEERYLFDTDPGDSLAICHGAAGTLAIADAFARYAGLATATALRDRLDAYLMDRLDEVVALGERTALLQNGATGVLAVLFAVRGGSRDWLIQYGLK